MTTKRVQSFGLRCCRATRCLIAGLKIDCGVGWLNVFDAELSPKRFWRGKRSQEVGEERERETNSERERERD